MSESVPELPRRVLLTGGSRGIGRAIGEQLASRGVRLALVGRDLPALARVAPPERGHVALEADLADPDAAVRATARAWDALGGLDAFVACAGVAEHAEVGAITRERLQRHLTVNFTSPFLMAQRCGTAMARGGSIVFVASTLALEPAPLTAAYAASKAALLSATRSLALELGPRGVRVNAVAPGVVDTEMIRALRPRPAGAPQVSAEQAVAEQLQALRALHPLGRLGRPDEIADAVLYLLCAPYVTATTLTVDGGLLLRSRRP